MSEEKDLLAQISQLAGHINQHKGYNVSYPFHGRWGESAFFGPNKEALTASKRINRGHNHRNRSLILNQSNYKFSHRQTPSDASYEYIDRRSTQDTGMETAGYSPQNWVSRRDRHIQLINASIYKKDASSRAKAIEETRKHKLAVRDAKERRKLTNYLALASEGKIEPTLGVLPHRVIKISGVNFCVTNEGSKLERIKGPTDMQQNTPKSTSVGGVRFVRSKNGNLYRAGLLRSKRLRPIRKRGALCKRFSMTGQCALGPRCAFIHDPDKVAICREFLRNGECPRSSQCDLSHKPSYERVPACLHFLRGSCSKPDCRYAHVKVNATARICRTFTTFGFCSDGVQCDDRHIFECPDYAASGVCPKSDCRLPHVDRAGQLRTYNGLLSDDELLNDAADLSSDGEPLPGYEDDDVDSDDLEEEILGAEKSFDSEYTKDFVCLSARGKT